jgi:hypothetical protein
MQSQLDFFKTEVSQSAHPLRLALDPAAVCIRSSIRFLLLLLLLLILRSQDSGFCRCELDGCCIWIFLRFLDLYDAWSQSYLRCRWCTAHYISWKDDLHGISDVKESV